MISSTTISFCRENVVLEVAGARAGKPLLLSSVSFFLPLEYRRKFSKFLSTLLQDETEHCFQSLDDEDSFAGSIEMFLERSWKQIIKDSVEELAFGKFSLVSPEDIKFLSSRPGAQILTGTTMEGKAILKFTIHLIL